LDEHVSFDELKSLWMDTLHKSTPKREHLSSTLSIFSDFNGSGSTFASFSSRLASFRDSQEDPNMWLAVDQASALADFLRAATARLTPWAGTAHFLAPQMQRALAITFDAHLSYVTDQTKTIQSLTDAQHIEEVLENVLEYAEIIKSASDPAACVEALRTLGVLGPDLDLNFLRAQHAPPSMGTDTTTLLQEALAISDWVKAESIAKSSRAAATEEGARQLDEVADFARTLIALDGPRPLKIQADLLEASARSLGTGHPVSRSIPERAQVLLALRFI
jgi:hypothetical protein